MSFYTSLSGLQAAQTNMSTISHNLANVATNGFKKSRTEFADVIASSVTTAPNQIIGSGTVTQGIRQQFGTGSLAQSSSALDLAITGNGFFAVKSEGATGEVRFTRNGSFAIDGAGYVTTAGGDRLQGYALDESGKPLIGALDSAISFQVPETNKWSATSRVDLDLTLPSSAGVPAGSGAAFARGDASTYNHVVQTTAYDGDGAPVTMSNYFVRQPNGDGTPSNTWKVYSFAGDTQLGTNASAPQPLTISFDAAGKVSTGTAANGAPVNEPFSLGLYTSGGTTPTQEFTLDLTGLTQSASAFSVQGNTANGSSRGEFSGVTVDNDGVVMVAFSNGETEALGQVAIANFTNPAGLKQIGSSSWTATGISGQAKLGQAGENGFGGIMSGMIEGSNVDITEELVGLIAAQRNFQANAKALDTASQISQSILNIRV